jgi:hypothetical protein
MQSGEIFSPPSGPDLIVMPKAIVLRQVIVFNNTWRVCIYVHVEREYLYTCGYLIVPSPRLSPYLIKLFVLSVANSLSTFI